MHLLCWLTKTLRNITTKWETENEETFLFHVWLSFHFVNDLFNNKGFYFHQKLSSGSRKLKRRISVVVGGPWDKNLKAGKWCSDSRYMFRVQSVQTYCTRFVQNFCTKSTQRICPSVSRDMAHISPGSISLNRV